MLALGGGSQEAFLGYAAGFGPPNPTFVWHPVDYTPVASAPVVIFSATTTVFDSTNGASDDFGWAMYNSAGAFLFFIDFDNASGKVYYLLNGQNAAYIATGSTFTPGKPYSLVVAMDYSQNRWGATLGGQSIVTQQPISQTSQKMDFGDADAVWVYGNAFRPGNNYMVFGNYSVTASPPVQ